MDEKIKFFESVRENYPKFITKDQFYRIAHISKATALYLLQSGKVPCRKTNKKTRCYKIRTEDVIAYLIDREINPAKYRASEMWYKDKSKSQKPKTDLKAKMLGMSDSQKTQFIRYCEAQFSEYDDLLAISELSRIIGYSETSLHRWCADKKLKAFFVSGKWLIPKTCFVDFLLTDYGIGIPQKNWKHTLLIKEFFDMIEAK